jgi:hypothetical protein
MLLLQIDEHGSAGMSFARSPIIDTENFDSYCWNQRGQATTKPTVFAPWSLA